MKILEVYILKRVFQMFLTALLPVLGIVWTTQVLVRINLVTDTGQSIGAFIKLATLILPTIIPIVLPFALVIGITQTLSTMNNDSELTVIDAAGSSRSVIVRPIILLSVVLSLFSFGVDNFVEPQVRQAARQMIASAYADLLSSIVEEKNFRKLQDGVYVQVSARGKGRSLEGLFVADTRDPATEMIYYSRRGAIDETGTALIMQDGEVHRKAANGNVSVIRFDSYTFDLSDLSAQKGKAKLSANDRDLAFLLNPDPEDPYYKDDPAEFRAELHSRFTEWLFPLAFGLISLTAAGGARSHRQAQVHPMVTAMILSFTVRWACFYAANSVGLSEGFILMMYAVPLVTILVCIYLLRRETRFACTVRFAAWLQGLWQQFQQRFARSGDAGGGAMILSTLGRYFFRRYAMTSMWFLVGVSSLVFFIDFSEVSGRMSNFPQYTVSGGLLMTAARLPNILMQTLPFIALFAGMATLMSLNRRYELVVTRAAGISIWQFMAPLLIGALLFGIAGTMILNPIAAWGTGKALGLEAVWRVKAGSSSPSIMPWLHQNNGEEDTIFGAQTVSKDGTELFGVTVIHLTSDNRIAFRQDARSAKLEDGYWQLNDVSETRPGERVKLTQSVQIRTNMKRDFMTETMSRPEAVAFFDIPRKIEVANALGISPRALQTQFHSLASLPFLLVAMTLIAACVSLKFSRFSQSRTVILGGIVAGFVLYVVTTLVKAFGSSGIVPPFVAAWLPVVVAMALGSTILLHQEDG